MACCRNRRLIELTNGNTGAVAVGALMPLGAVTRMIGMTPKCTPTWTVSTTMNNVVTVSESGIYTATYTGTLVVAEDGDVTVDMLLDGVVIASRTITAVADASVNIAMVKEIRVYCDCCNGANPVTLALRVGGVPITTANGSFILDGTVNV